MSGYARDSPKELALVLMGNRGKGSVPPGAEISMAGIEGVHRSGRGVGGAGGLSTNRAGRRIVRRGRPDLVRCGEGGDSTSISG